MLLSLEEIRTGVLTQLEILLPNEFSELNFLIDEIAVNHQRNEDTPLIGVDFAATRGQFAKDTSEFAQVYRSSEGEIFSYDFFLLCSKETFATYYFNLSKAINRYSMSVSPQTTSFRLQIGGKQGSFINQRTNTLMILFSTRWDFALPSTAR